MEHRLWQSIRSSRLEGLKFSRQIVLGGFICDFVCRNLRLVIEIDGETHDRAKDADRDHLLGRMGYQVVRFTNADVMGNLDGVLGVILEAARGRPTKLDIIRGETHPQPLPWQGGE